LFILVEWVFSGDHAAQSLVLCVVFYM
jgi:hypothetical protein